MDGFISKGQLLTSLDKYLLPGFLTFVNILASIIVRHIQNC